MYELCGAPLQTTQNHPCRGGGHASIIQHYYKTPIPHPCQQKCPPDGPLCPGPETCFSCTTVGFCVTSLKKLGIFVVFRSFARKRRRSRLVCFRVFFVDFERFLNVFLQKCCFFSKSRAGIAVSVFVRFSLIFRVFFVCFSRVFVERIESAVIFRHSDPVNRRVPPYPPPCVP
jgi:hypothetical protein